MLEWVFTRWVDILVAGFCAAGWVAILRSPRRK
jgi:hypothetical protein